MSARHLLVTGGAGFIGSHLVDELLAAGDTVTVVDNFFTGQRKHLPTAHPRLRILEKDVATFQPTDIDGPLDGVVHLAAIPSVGLSWQRLLATHEVNLSHTLKMAEMTANLGCRRLVFASSAAVYGVPTALPLIETAPTTPISPYGLQKKVSEDYLALIAPSRDLQAVALRFFNVFGPRQDPHSEYSGVVSRFASAAQEGKPMVIHGSGDQTRDFVDVRDVVQSLLAALTVPMAASGLLRCNVGTGRAVSVRTLAETLRQCTRSMSPITHEAARAGDISQSFADLGQLRTVLGVTPRHTLLDGLKRLLLQPQPDTT